MACNSLQLPIEKNNQHMIVYLVTKIMSCPHHPVYLLQVVTISVVVTITIITSQKIVKFITVILPAVITDIIDTHIREAMNNT